MAAKLIQLITYSSHQRKQRRTVVEHLDLAGYWAIFEVFYYA